MTYSDKKLALEKVLGSRAKLETKTQQICAIILDGSPNKGEIGELFFLIHHGVLIEPLLEPLENRVRYVLTSKLKHQRLVRLTEMAPVLNMPSDVSKALATYNKARAAFNNAWAAYCKARATYGREWAAYCKARATYNRALNAVAWTAIHKAQVPETTWNGKTIEGVPA